MTTQLTFAQAERVGQQLHDHLLMREQILPPTRDDLGWADIVQFVLRASREVAASSAWTGDPPG